MVAQSSAHTLRLFPRQMRFVKSAAPYPAYIGGIGSGKSFAGSAKVISRIGKREIGMIAAPTYPMLRDSTLEGFFTLLESLGIPYDYLRSDNTITFASGHKILCRSLDDPDRVRGPNLNYVWGDEAAYFSPEAWQIIKGRVRVGDQPQAWITGTPKGRNWIWEEWERDATGNEFDPVHPLFRVRTEENPELPPGFATSLGYAGSFASQELGGEFVAFDGLVYPMFNRPQNVQTVDCDGWATVLGLDLGTRNPTAVLTCRYAGDRFHVEREVYQRGMSSDEITDAALAAWSEADNPEYIVVDPSAAGLILSLQARGLRVRKATNDVVVGISTVTSTLPHMTVDPSCVNTIAEFESYAYKTGGRTDGTDSPVKSNDHSLDVIRYLCLELYGRPAQRWGIM